MSDEKPQNFNLTLTQISAGAFAATAAAAIGSELGVAGTVVGAALGSVTTSVAAALYQHSVERSRAAARALTQAHKPARDVTGEPPDGDQPARHDEQPAEGRCGGEPAHDQPGEEPVAGTSGRRRMAVAIGVLAAFVLSLVTVTGIEAFRGEPLSGGGGTTVGRVLDGDGRSPGPQPQAPPATSSTPPPTTTEPASTTTAPPLTTTHSPATTGTPSPTISSAPGPTTISDQGPSSGP